MRKKKLTTFTRGLLEFMKGVLLGEILIAIASEPVEGHFLFGWMVKLLMFILGLVGLMIDTILVKKLNDYIYVNKLYR